MAKQFEFEVDLAVENRNAIKKRQEMEAADMLKMINNCKKTNGLKQRLLKSVNYQTRHDGTFNMSLSLGHVTAIFAAIFVGVVAAKAIRAK